MAKNWNARACDVLPSGADAWVSVTDMVPVREAIAACTMERTVSVNGHTLRRYVAPDGRRWVTDSYGSGRMRMRMLPWPWMASWNTMITEIRNG